MKEPILRATIEDENGNEKELNSPASMVAAIAASNEKRQKQCEGTPFMTQPLLNDFGYLANREYAEQVMQGTYEAPEGTCPYAIEFIKALKMPESIRDAKKITLEVTPEENRSAWKKMKDKTSSASQAPAFRQYKIASTDNTLNQIDADLRSIPMTVGICPEEWCKTDDVMIKKDREATKLEI